VAERQFGPYRLVRQIAVGGMAEIHLAKTKGIAGFEKYVALKMIHPNFAEDDQFIQMLVDEAKIAVQLTHGNIAQTFDLGRVGETYYITMEYVDGADLYKILRRASEQDLELPLDVCAFVGKEIASALDHAHRKRDHVGKPLGIVHRDVSPQNVLISYSGEVKLVDFGIAKATMKARQTAVGVIKGKYYYMSPEQAWGDSIDYRSDIFSAGIVLYEMLTGQMLYLEEDLHKLLDMARKAEIAPPSKLRKGVPPQLERIVMHALQKLPSERYQSAGDFATDLERFLHTYSPVFTAGKISSLIKKVIGDPVQVVDEQGFPSIEVRDGAMSTLAIDDSELAHAEDRDDLVDENSVIFRVAELKPPKGAPAATFEPRTIKLAEKVAPKPAKPRQINEETRQLMGVPPAGPSDEVSGLLSPPPPGKRAAPAPAWDANDTNPGDDLENIGERTVISEPPTRAGFMMDAGEDSVDATMISDGPPPHDTSEDTTDQDADDEEGPTLAREVIPRAPRTPKGRAQPPPALAAKIHAPAVSELRKPKASRRTPPGGVPQSNVLQQIVGSQASEPMPVPRPAEQQQPQQFPSATPGGQPAMSYSVDASGLPLGVPTPPSGYPVLPTGVPPHLQPYLHMQGVPPGYPQQPGYPPQGYPPQGYPPQGYPPQGYPPQGYPPQPGVSPGAMYQMSSYPVQPMTLTGQMRLFEADELPSQFRLGAARKRWFTYIVAGMLAVSVAAIATYLIIMLVREAPPVTTATIEVSSVPEGGIVFVDGKQQPNPLRDVPFGNYELRVELPGHRPHVERIDVKKDVNLAVRLEPITGKLIVDSFPDGAEIRINDQLKGVTPKTVPDLDMKSANKLELRFKGYQPYVVDLKWPASGQITINANLKR
jgi:serine/threonine protein kinase